MLADISKELTPYYQTNDHLGCDPGTLWEVLKTVLRGILKHGTRIKKEQNEELSLILSRLYSAESRHTHAPSHALEMELELLRKQITDLLHYKAKAALQFCRKTNYEAGDKCGKVLARMVRELTFPTLCAPPGRKIHSPHK